MLIKEFLTNYAKLLDRLNLLDSYHSLLKFIDCCNCMHSNSYFIAADLSAVKVKVFIDGFLRLLNIDAVIGIL